MFIKKKKKKAMTTYSRVAIPGDDWLECLLNSFSEMLILLRSDGKVHNQIVVVGDQQ